jgi:hypothetical protein
MRHANLALLSLKAHNKAKPCLPPPTRGRRETRMVYRFKKGGDAIIAKAIKLCWV